MKLRKDRAKRIDFAEICHPRQRLFVEDVSKFTTACCSRRAGKTYGVRNKLLKTGFDHPKALSLYLTMSRSMGMDILWPAVEELNDQLDLGITLNQNKGDIKLPNGHKIMMRGIGSMREADKLRGPKYVGVCVDEGQGFGYQLNKIIDEILEPATFDYEDSWIAVTGTPNAACSGPFYDMYHGVQPDGSIKQVWSPHHWTFFNREDINNAEERAAQVRERRGWTTETPSYIREYMGLWVKDTEGAAFHINSELNIVYRFPEEMTDDWRYVLGVDLGIVDPCAFVVIAYSQNLGQAYILESREVEADSPSESASEVLRMLDKYGPMEVIADTGGQGKAHVGEWAQTYGLSAAAAQKHDKGGRVSLINADLRSGNLFIVAPQNHQLIQELSILQIDDDALEAGRFVYARGFKDHLADALQYAFGGCHHYSVRLRRSRIVTPEEYYKNLEDKMEADASRRAKSAMGGRTWRELRRQYYRRSR